MSERIYTLDQIWSAVPNWLRHLSNEPDISPDSFRSMQFLRHELDSGPHWVVEGRISLQDPLGQRVTVYWSKYPHDPVFTLVRPSYSEEWNREGMEKLLDVLERYYPHGPAGYQGTGDEE